MAGFNPSFLPPSAPPPYPTQENSLYPNIHPEGQYPTPPYPNANNFNDQLIQSEQNMNHPPQTQFDPTVRTPIQGPYRWVDIAATYGQVPPSAVHGGIDVDGHAIYVGRAYHEGDWLPAKVIPGKNVAYVCYGGEEHAMDRYEILCEQRLNWTPASDGNVPPGAIPAGRTSEGEILYVGRAYHEGSQTVGKVHPSHGSCYIPFDGEEIAHTSYEVLTQFVLLHEGSVREVLEDAVVLAQAVVLREEARPVVAVDVGEDHQVAVVQVLAESLHHELVLRGIVADFVEVLEEFGDAGVVLLRQLGDVVRNGDLHDVDDGDVQPAEERLEVVGVVDHHLLHLGAFYEERAVLQDRLADRLLHDPQVLEKTKEKCLKNKQAAKKRAYFVAVLEPGHASQLSEMKGDILAVLHDMFQQQLLNVRVAELYILAELLQPLPRQIVQEKLFHFIGGNPEHQQFEEVGCDSTLGDFLGVLGEFEVVDEKRKLDMLEGQGEQLVGVRIEDVRVEQSEFDVVVVVFDRHEDFVERFAEVDALDGAGRPVEQPGKVEDGAREAAEDLDVDLAVGCADEKKVEFGLVLENVVLFGL